MIDQDNTPPQLANLTNLGNLSTAPPSPLPPSVQMQRHVDYVRLQEPGIVKNLNARRDMNTTHDFEYWAVRDSELNDYSAFNDIHMKVLANRELYNNFSGSPDVDFTNVTLAERQYYSDFLGINFSKIGHAIGSAATSVGHAVRGVTVGAAHDVRNAALGVAHVTRDLGEDAAHVGEKVGVNIGKNVEGQYKATRDHFEKQIQGTEAAFKAVEPYWKDIASVALVAVLAATGVGLPLALAIGGTLLTGLNAVGNNTAELPAGFGAGGDGGGEDSGIGMPDISDDGDGDTGQNLTPEQMAQKQAANQQKQQAQLMAQAEAIAKKRKMMMIAGGIVAAILVYYFFFRKK